MKTKSLSKMIGQALRLHRAGRFDAAEKIYRNILRARPEQPDALHYLGVLVHQARCDPQGPELIRRAIAARPEFPQAYSNLGNMLVQRGEGRGALDACRRAVELAPGFAEAHNNLGSALKMLGRLDDAIASYLCAVQLDPRYQPALCNLGMALHEAKRFEQALAVHCHAQALDPKSPDGYANTAVTLHALGRFAEAEALFAQAIALNPRHARAIHNRALALDELGRTAEATAGFRAALAVDPTEPEYHWNYALALLRGADFAAGWTEYEWRWRLRRFPSRLRHQGWVRWDGSPLGGRRLLVYEEQGLGDTIQFVRYLPRLAAGGERVVFECQPELARLLAGLPGVEVVPTGAPLPPFDVQVPLLSVPGMLGTTLDTIPAEVPYVRPHPEDVRRWSEQLAGSTGRRVGLVWSGSPTHARDAARSIALERLLPLFAVPGLSWFSLQVGARAAEARHVPAGTLTDLAPYLGDFAQTAAAISQLDLLVTVDTAAAHVAGSLARPAWVVLDFFPDWRWLRDRDDSPWYPTVQLFRQPRHGDWGAVVERVAAELRRFAVTEGGNDLHGWVVNGATVRRGRRG